VTLRSFLKALGIGFLMPIPTIAGIPKTPSNREVILTTAKSCAGLRDGSDYVVGDVLMADVIEHDGIVPIPMNAGPMYGGSIVKVASFERWLKGNHEHDMQKFKTDVIALCNSEPTCFTPVTHWRPRIAI